MKKEELTTLGLTDEQADKILAMNGKDIEKAAEDAKGELATLTQQLADRDKDLEDIKASAQDAEGLKKQLEELQGKYNTETEDYKKQLADRDYADALTAAISGEKVAFTSKAAEKSIRDALMADRLALKDGKLEGFADRLKSLRESDPDAFKSDKPDPQFSGPMGAGGVPSGLSRAAQAARAAGARFNPAPAGNAGAETTN